MNEIRLNDMSFLTLQQPGRLVFGAGSLSCFFDDVRSLGKKRLFVLSLADLRGVLSAGLQSLESLGISWELNVDVSSEPSFFDVEHLVQRARSFGADAVVGVGGGSVMDSAKFVAAQLMNNQTSMEIVGNGKLNFRSTYLVCVPTTSGSGSEVSPNAIFLDLADGEKKGCVSPYLVPDAVYVDPELMFSLPPRVTAFTGIDAFTHCLEAYLNVNHHGMTDFYAIEGMRLIMANLERCCVDGNNVEARMALALGSYYGGMCLGPVNTAGVHALAYPLGSKFQVAHGLSNALMLPHVLKFNLPSCEERLAALFLRLGFSTSGSVSADAADLVDRICAWLSVFDIPNRLSALGVKEIDLEMLAVSAMKVQRLLVNNPRELHFADALAIYGEAF